MRDDASLEVADVVGRVVNELNVPDAMLMRLLEPLEFSIEEVVLLRHLRWRAKTVNLPSNSQLFRLSACKHC